MKMMKTTSLLVVLLLFAGAASVAVAQTPAVAHNTWTSGSPMPTAVWDAAVGVLEGQIYVVGGNDADGTIVADTQIYNPATNTWSTGVSLPTPLAGASGAVVKDVLYVMGGNNGSGYTNGLWAFNLKTQTWSSKAAIPISLEDAGAAVENNIIYLAGGNSTQDLRSNAVYSYNPATDAWTEEAPLLVGRSEPSVRRVETTIVVTDGYASGGDTEGYDPTTNMWTTLMPDPAGWRSWACTGHIGAKLYVVGGYFGDSLNESFNLPENTWKTLAPMPQAAMATGSAVYEGQLYCLGGTVAYWENGALSNVQIYQP